MNHPMGVFIALLMFAGVASAGQFPAVKVEIVDSTGAGDALTATVIFGMLQGIELDESLHLGLRAAALTLHSSETVVPDLSLDRLYSLGDNQNKEVDRFDVSVADYDPYDEY